MDELEKRVKNHGLAISILNDRVTDELARYHARIDSLEATVGKLQAGLDKVREVEDDKGLMFGTWEKWECNCVDARGNLQLHSSWVNRCHDCGYCRPAVRSGG